MGIIQLAFLILGVYSIVQRSKVNKIKAEDYPELPVNDFFEWKQHKLNSIKYNIWAGLGVFVFQVIFIVVFMYLLPGVDQEISAVAAPIVANTIGFIALLIFGIIGAGHADKAKKIAKRNNIVKMPR